MLATRSRPLRCHAKGRKYSPSRTGRNRKRNVGSVKSMDRRGRTAGRRFYRGPEAAGLWASSRLCAICGWKGALMPQLHLYVPDQVASLVRQRARARKMTVSGYLAELVRREVAMGWPTDFFDEFVGGWSGTPLRRPPQGRPEGRDRL